MKPLLSRSNLRNLPYTSRVVLDGCEEDPDLEDRLERGPRLDPFLALAKETTNGSVVVFGDLMNDVVEDEGVVDVVEDVLAEEYAPPRCPPIFVEFLLLWVKYLLLLFVVPSLLLAARFVVVVLLLLVFLFDFSLMTCVVASFEFRLIKSSPSFVYVF